MQYPNGERNIRTCHSSTESDNITTFTITLLFSGQRWFLEQNNKMEQVNIMLCATTAKTAKAVNKYIHILFKARENIGNGENVLNLRMVFSLRVL